MQAVEGDGMISVIHRARLQQREQIYKMKKYKLLTEITYLGLVLDLQLKFDKHVKKISKTIQSSLNCFKLIRLTHYVPN